MITLRQVNKILQSIYVSKRADTDEDYNVWLDRILPYMAARGFSPAFLQTSPDLLGLPEGILMGTPPDNLDDPKFAEPIIILTPVFVWKLEPSDDNIEKLVAYLEYKVPLPELDVPALDLPVHLDLNTSLSGEGSRTCHNIQVIFHHHIQRSLRLQSLVRDSPRSFLKFLAAVNIDENVSDIELWDCLRSIELVADDYFQDGYKPETNPPPESAMPIEQLWRQLIEGGLPLILMDMLDCLFVLPAISCLTRIMRALVLWCAREPMEVTQARRDTTRGIVVLLDKFWQELWIQRKLLVKTAKPLYLVYHSAMTSQDLVILGLSLLAGEYIMLSRAPHSETPSRDAYLNFSRVLLFIWFIPAVKKGPPEPEIQHTLCMMVSLFTQHSSHSGLTKEDFTALLDREVYSKHGHAELLLTSASLALRASPLDKPRRSFERDTSEILDVMREFLVRPQCKPYFVSSGLLQTVRDLVDSQLVRALSPDAQWFVQRSAITLLERIVTLAPTGRAAKALLRGYNIFAIIEQAVIVYATASESHVDDHTIVNIIDMYITIAGGSQARGGRDELLYAMKRALQAHWYPAYRDLYAMVQYDARGAPFGKAVRPLEHWIELGKTLGLAAEHEKEAYERKAAQMCGWRECQFHETKPPMPTRVCAGCGEVRYCSKGCQKRDWREGGHGARCKRLKEEAHAHSRRGEEQKAESSVGRS